MKAINKVILYSALIGYLLMIIATYLATVSIPALDDKISDINQFEERIDDKIFRGLMFYLDYKQTELKNRINHLERNGFITRNIQNSERLKLENRILNTQYFLIEMWSKLFVLDEIALEDKDIINNTDEIIKKRKSFNDINLQLQELLVKSKMKAEKRLNVIQEKMKEEKNKREEIKHNKDFYRSIFNWSQIIGLILLSFSGVLEKTSKKTTNENKNTI